MMQQDGKRFAELVTRIIVQDGVMLPDDIRELVNIEKRMPRSRDGVPLMAGDAMQRKPSFQVRTCELRVAKAHVSEYLAAKEQQ